MAESEIAKRLLQARLDMAARLGREVPKSEIAHRVGMPAPTYGRYENGDRKVEATLLGPIAEALETTVEYLVTGRRAVAAVSRHALPDTPDEPVEEITREAAEAAVRAEEEAAGRRKPRRA